MEGGKGLKKFREWTYGSAVAGPNFQFQDRLDLGGVGSFGGGSNADFCGAVGEDGGDDLDDEACDVVCGLQQVLIPDDVVSDVFDAPEKFFLSWEESQELWIPCEG